MAPRQGFRPRSRISSRRKTSWAIGPSSVSNGNSQSISVAGKLLLSGGAAIGLDGLTDVRLRGELNIWLESATAAANGFFGAFGIAYVTAPAFTIGVTAVPGPIAEEDWDGWMYHRYFSLFSAGPIAAATAAQEALQVNNVAAAARIEVDSKAMRKTSLDMVQIAVVEVAEAGTAVMKVAFNCRTLVKLP